MKVAFLDRDGTIVEDYADQDWQEVKLPSLLPGAIHALQRLAQQGYQMIVITNQYLIGEGIITQAQYESFTENMSRALLQYGVEFLDIFYCPDSRSKNSHNVKPNPGMIEAAFKKYPNIGLQQSFLAGDSECDIMLANRVGLKSFGIGFDKNRTDCIPVTALSDVPDLV